MGKTSRVRAAVQHDYRALRRQVANVERLTGGVLLPRPMVEEFMRVQRMLVAFVKREGRVRFKAAELEALKEGDSLKAKVDGEYTTLTYEPAPPPVEEEPPAEPEEGRSDVG